MRVRIAILDEGDPARLRAPARAGLDLLPHQLEPAIEVVRHGASRLLLADAVGLGKTIQAGLVLAELRDRSVSSACSSSRRPGCAISGRRAAAPVRLRARMADAAWLRAMRAEWPASLNPWSVPGVHVASIDFAKRPEVCRSLDHIPWDVVVVDEAHTAAAESDRREVAHLCARARGVLLLTATPHGGDEAAFHSLCRIGALADDDPIALFRRTRADVGMTRRRHVRLVKVGAAAAEATVRRQLRRVHPRRLGAASRSNSRDARLAMIVLIKRSLSGMAPLAGRSARRRNARRARATWSGSWHCCGTRTIRPTICPPGSWVRLVSRTGSKSAPG